MKRRYNKNNRLITAAAIFLAICTGFLDGNTGELVCRKNSLYTGIFVYKNNSVCTMRFGMRANAPIQSQVDIDNPRMHMLEYTELAFCGLLYNSNPRSVLVLGQGGGVIPREMHYYYPEAIIDVVEIDAEIPKIAERYFGFKSDNRLKVHIDDGRMFIKKKLLRNPEYKYDYIVLDAFNGDYIPFHLMTKEFLQEVKSVLRSDGVVVANVFSSNRLFDAELKTFLAVFENCQVFACSYSANAIIAALGSQCKPLGIREAVEKSAEMERTKLFQFDAAALGKRLCPDTATSKDAYVLTDDRAPVNWLKEKESLKK